jgi:hypothetical protein
MNNIHEKDWAEDGWSCHSGMASNPYEEDDPPPREAKESGAGAGRSEGE